MDSDYRRAYDSGIMEVFADCLIDFDVFYRSELTARMKHTEIARHLNEA